MSEWWDSRPCNSRHSDAVDPLTYSQEVTARKRLVEPHLWAFADFPRWAGKRVLDLGCGIGTESLEFARHGAEVVALDYSERSLDVAWARAKGEGLVVDWRLHDIQRPFLEGRLSFDLVWAWGSVHHVERPEAVLRWVPLYLAPGGELRLMVYHRFSTKALRLWAAAWFPRDFDGAVARGSEAQPMCPRTHTFTRRSVQRYLESAGLDVLSVKVTHIFPWQGDAYGRHEWVKGWPWKALPHEWLEPVLGWHLMVVAR